MIVIAAAIITPTGDPFTLTAVALPLYALYELSIFMIKESKDDDEEEEETVNSKAAGNKPDGPKLALEKKPDGGGDPDAPAAEAKEIKPEDKDIHETLRLQREAADQAKVEAKNKALQERLDKAAAVGVAGATAEAAKAADGTVKELTANTEPSVKDALAEAATTTAKKTRIVKKREPRMVIVNDEIFWEEGPEIEVEEEIPESEETDQATEQKAADNTPTAAVDSPTEAVSEEATTDVLAETPTEAPTDVPAEMPADAAPKKAPVAESSLESPYMDETVNQPEALQTPYYDDPEAMPDLSKYYAEIHQEMAEEETAEAVQSSVEALSEAIPAAPTTPVSPSANDIVEQARMAAENARKAAEQAVKAAQEAARIAEETAKAAEEAAKAAAEEAAKAAAKSAIDVSGIRYDYGRFNS